MANFGVLDGITITNKQNHRLSNTVLTYETRHTIAYVPQPKRIQKFHIFFTLITSFCTMIPDLVKLTSFKYHLNWKKLNYSNKIVHRYNTSEKNTAQSKTCFGNLYLITPSQ